MGIISRLFGGKQQSDPNGDPEGLHVYVKCDKCGEKIHIRANRRTDVTQEYPDESSGSVLVLHKEILGSNCQNLMYVHLTLDPGYRIVESETERCTLITKEQFESN
ncbi:MAG: hypothetical protein JWO59_1988 [Chloroflexi bacterium]|nr:hypothetical protein [Chloroflexota bacterium]MDB5075636.1 hypothetical protein [Chloroflexota bacterium]